MNKLFAVLVFAVLLLCSCGSGEPAGTKINDIDFTVVSPNDILPEIRDLVEERQSEPFKLTYSDGDYMYIVVGYGEQSSGGYSITVDQLYLADNGIYIETNLVGPSKEDVVDMALSYPYIVIKIQNIDKIVIFN